MTSGAEACPHCGAMTARGATFCQVCGARIALSTGPSVAAVLLAVLLLLGAAGLGLFGACFVLIGIEGGVSLLAVGGVALGLALAAAFGAAALLTPRRLRSGAR